MERLKELTERWRSQAKDHLGYPGAKVNRSYSMAKGITYKDCAEDLDSALRLIEADAVLQQHQRKRQIAPGGIKLKEAFIDETGVFHCQCGASHSRGPFDGHDFYRCLNCGDTAHIPGASE